MIQSELNFMTQSNEFTHQLESKLQWTAYKALFLFFSLCPLLTKPKRLEDGNEGEYQQTLPAY